MTGDSRTVEALVATIGTRLRGAADPVRAPQMQRYMRSSMPFLGVGVPTVRRIAREAAQERPGRTPEDLLAAATTLWRAAGFREERYAATELALLRHLRGRLDALGVLQEMIVTGAWWDHVDAVAHGIGDLLLAHPAVLTPRLHAWSVDPDIWLRRSSILCQLGHRGRTDTALLAQILAVNTTHRDFFVRKAIGWALRDYARTDPDWVRSFVAEHADTLSPLSRREATKHLTVAPGPAGTARVDPAR